MALSPAGPPAVLASNPSRWLDALTDRAAVLAGRLATAAGDRVTDLDAATAAGARRRAGILATLRLDGSPLEDLADTELLAAPPSGAAPRAPDDAKARGTWFDAMRTFAAPADEELLRAEARGAAAALVADDLVAPLAADPQPTLAELHRRLTDGLVAPARAGRPRASEQAVHDASLGRIIYFTADPAQLPAALAGLADWLAGDAADLPGLHAAGLLHLELLRLHPYDAANGRLARAAARLWLRGAGLDPAGLAVPELLLADDPLGYHEQVAGSLRRRDATIWLERWAEAVVAGLRGSLHALTGPPTPAAADLLTDLPATFTLADLRDRRPGGGDLEPLWDELADLEDAALVAVVPGTRGLRFRRTDPPA